MPDPSNEHALHYRSVQAERKKFTELTNEELTLIALSTIINEQLPQSPYNSALRLELLERGFPTSLDYNERVNEEKSGEKLKENVTS